MIIEQPAASAHEQAALERQVARFFEELAAVPLADRAAHLALRRDAHAAYTHKGLARLPGGFIGLDASRPWLTFWMVHSLALLQQPLPAEVAAENIVRFLQRCQAPSGGFGGGPGQLPHLAPTYAAVATLVTLGGPAALQAVDRQAMLGFLQRMCVPAHLGGGFFLCKDGEVDVRGCYCAMATAHMLDLDAKALAQAASMVEYVRSCQTYEGGIGGEPGNEAHGGYTFCGLAAVALAGAAEALDLPGLACWAVSCQGTIEGGFMGRTNKLVDGCYSYWQGALFPLLQSLQQPQQQFDLMMAASAGPAGPAPAAASRQQHSPSAARQEAAGPMKQTESSAQRMGTSRSTSRSITVPPLPDLPRRGLLAHAAETAAALQALESEQSSSPQPAEAVHLAEASVRAEGFAAAAQNCATVLAMRWGADADAGKAAAARSSAAQPAATAGCNSAGSNAGAASVAAAAEADGISCRPAALAGTVTSTPLYDVEALQLWLLQCCQAIKGGLRDKPGKPVDYYHTCYCLSGLSAAQHYGGVVVGPPDNLLAAADPLCNVLQPRLTEARHFYAGQPVGAPQ